MKFADIIVDISLENLDKTYQYIIPQELESTAVIGAPVRIPFGKGSRLIDGYIVSISEKRKIDMDKMKTVESVKSQGLIIESKLISLAYWIRENFGATMNEALHTVIPVKKSVKPIEKKTLVLNDTLEAANLALNQAIQKNHVAKKRLLLELIKEKELEQEFVISKLNISRQTISSLEKAGIIKIKIETRYRNPIGDFEYGTNSERYEKNSILNPEQQKITDQILSEYQAGFRKTYLLYGVTGSGKTEIYLSVIEFLIAQKKQVIMLIPEIALTYQTVLRFYKRFGDRVSIMNSKMSQGERYDQCLRAKRGEIDVMIGPRSALFTPFPNLGLLILDEEHEGSYKSEMPPKYHSREVAIERARRENAFVMLGSATPSLEAYTRAVEGRYEMLRLTERAKSAKKPIVHIVDLREELKKKNKSIFSIRLKELMSEKLKRKQQIMLFLNRRGYAGFVSCRSCGEAMKCPHCDVSLTSHNNGSLVCHYCGHTELMPSSCPLCGSKYIAAFGTGTQKVEEMVKKEFPKASVLRMDADTTKSKESHEAILSAFANGEADILIGTQMIVKGHDFPRVTLVGVLAADLSLFAGNYMASERTFELLAQAAGRAGRGEEEGEVVIQTYQPEHYSIVTAAAEDYEKFYSFEINYRKLMGYPPASNILVILMLCQDEKKVEEAAGRIGSTLKQLLTKYNYLESTGIIGPAPAGLTKANDIYRRVIYIKQKQYAVLIRIKNSLEEYIADSSLFSSCTIQFDFNPVTGY